MARVITDAGVDLGDVIDQAALAYYRREPGFSIDGTVVGGGPALPERPADSANKPVWVDYALAVEKARGNDVDEESLNAVTKDELIASYGGGE